jgi:DNA-binding response OmpR family regulator
MPMDSTGPYVLIVEDDPDIQRLLKTTLSFNGYRVLTAPNGYEGLKAIEQERPALVIADIMMPKMDGFGLVNRLRIHPDTRELPVVIITATYVAPEDQEFAQNIGATRFIQKPIDLEHFLEVIRDVLEQGVSAAPEPPKGFDFYDGYRTRLEVKLEQRNVQIARYEFLLSSTLSSEEHLAVQASLTRALSDRQEIKLLLEEVRQHLKEG